MNRNQRRSFVRLVQTLDQSVQVRRLHYLLRAIEGVQSNLGVELNRYANMMQMCDYPGATFPKFRVDPCKYCQAHFNHWAGCIKERP